MLNVAAQIAPDGAQLSVEALHALSERSALWAEGAAVAGWHGGMDARLTAGWRVRW